MLKGRGRNFRQDVGTVPGRTPAQTVKQVVTPSLVPSSTRLTLRTPTGPAPIAKPEPDYEVVEFPSEQYVNAKLQPPPPPPPRPPTGHPLDAGASCGLCGGGGARVRCAECGRRALCASCDDMYHRHPKRRHHQRQALSSSQLREDRPPLPPKGTPPVPPPRRHKIGGDRMSASPRPPSADPRSATLGPTPIQSPNTMNNHTTMRTTRPNALPPHLQGRIPMGSTPFLPSMHHTPPVVPAHNIGHPGWNRPRGSLPGFNVPPNMHVPTDNWESPEISTQNWGRPMRRGASVLELGGGGEGAGCGAGCTGAWRYGSCASLEHAWAAPPTHAWQHAPPCCAHTHTHPHSPYTPQPYRRAESRAGSRVSVAGTRAVSPAGSSRSRASRRHRHRPPSPPSPPSVPSSDADSEPGSDSDSKNISAYKDKPVNREDIQSTEETLGPAPEPPQAPWQCEHCTFVNEPGERVCAVCCRTPLAAPRLLMSSATSSNTPTVSDSARAVADSAESISRLHIQDVTSNSSLSRTNGQSHSHNGRTSQARTLKKERISTGCGPSPPREEIKRPTSRLTTPPQERTFEHLRSHDVAVGASPPKDINHRKNSIGGLTNRPSPYREAPKAVGTTRHNVSVGSSPPREIITRQATPTVLGQNTSIGTSPPRNHTTETRTSSRANTGTSPPPQSISTQTYEVPSTWERAPSRSRSRRRFRDDARRERSHSRHSLSSDTRESERTSGGGERGRWEWRSGRDSSPGGEWSGSEQRRGPRLARRASHLDLRRTRQPQRRTTYYGSETASPERTRAISLEALAGAGAGAGATERGLELARLMADAERLGFNAAEVRAAVTQSPEAPLRWLRERWSGLCEGVRAAAERLEPRARVSPQCARAALARTRGALWPAVTACIDAQRRALNGGESNSGRVSGRVWGSPAGADDDAVPPRADISSDELEEAVPTRIKNDKRNPLKDTTSRIFGDRISDEWELRRSEQLSTDESLELERQLAQSRDDALLEELLSYDNSFSGNKVDKTIPTYDFIQSEKDFIEAYNALTRTTPLPIVDKTQENKTGTNIKTEAIHIVPNQMPNKIFHLEGNNHNENNLPTQVYPIIKDATQNNVQLLNKEIFNNQESFTENDQKPQPESNSFNVQSLIGLNINSNVELTSGATEYSIPLQAHILSNNDTNTLPSDNVHNFDIKRQQDDKPNNLNDIVDNTQKLIQQMKDEINLDISSIDSRNISQSEADTSSDESDLSTERESNYSESGVSDTENLTSDDDESSNSDSVDKNASRRPTVIERTSSEENEQFEEAMDHIEEQIEDFKNTNIEILDSIARSLQEQHSISTETSGQKLKNDKSSDRNNNLFVKINSFDEIYEEIKSDHSEAEQIGGSDKADNIIDIPKMVAVETSQLMNVSKHMIFLGTIKSENATKLIISENIHVKQNAILNDINEISVTHVDEDAENIQIPKETLIMPPTLVNEIKTADSSSIIVSEVNPQPYNNIFDLTSEPTESIQNEIGQNLNDEIDTNSITQNKDTVNAQDASSVDIKNVSNSIQHILSDTSNVTNNTKTTTGKSNIPKLIKLVPNSKSKSDNKTSPSVIASKVPVRRASIKQYPAPAPPKSHFGNIQSGHVKQLQTRLFNNKLPKTALNLKNTQEAKPSTSTIQKKKQAPPPPLIKPKQDTPTENSPHKEKRHYIRESCRTEDEWTESDSDDSQMQTKDVIEKIDEPQRAPSPPPPITLRRVSGQIIDLATVQLPEGSPERQARMLLAQGATETWEQARLAAELAARGAAAPAALLAALDCVDLTSALAYLHQECELCASKLSEHEMVSMLRCTHRCCRECARHYFTVQITERSIADCVCPYCKLPDLENLPEDEWLEYFAHLDILLKTLLANDVHELFQRKLRDRTLARDPNFRWCVECSSGFFVHPKQKRIRCPECRSVSCAKCKKPWVASHEGLSCEQFAEWQEDNDPERSMAAVQLHLRDHGLQCPRCHYNYSLSRGGCMHFTCTQCKYEFCYGCDKPFMMGARCGLSEYCAKLGLHAHHPRNCLFYLRDKEPHQLQTLLQMNNVPFETEAPEGSSNRCPIPLQRETPTGLVDGICGSEIQPNHAGLCKDHYLEYLCRAVRTRGVDPLAVLDATDLETVVRRAALRPPPRPYGSPDGLYRRALQQVCHRPHYVERLAGEVRRLRLDPLPVLELPDLLAELRRRALPLPDRGPWDTDPIYAGICAQIVKDKIPLD